MTDQSEKKQLAVRVPLRQKAELEAEAAERDVSRSEYIREILGDRGDDAEADGLRDQIDGLHDRIDRLQQKLADRDARIEDLEAERDGLAEEVETLEEEVADLESEITSLEARNTDLTNQLAEANSRIDAANEVVEYVESERSASERYREAGLLGKVKYTVFGMNSDDSDDV